MEYFPRYWISLFLIRQKREEAVAVAVAGHAEAEAEEAVVPEEVEVPEEIQSIEPETVHRHETEQAIAATVGISIETKILIEMLTET